MLIQKAAYPLKRIPRHRPVSDRLWKPSEKELIDRRRTRTNTVSGQRPRSSSASRLNPTNHPHPRRLQRPAKGHHRGQHEQQHIGRQQIVTDRRPAPPGTPNDNPGNKGGKRPLPQGMQQCPADGLRDHFFSFLALSNNSRMASSSDCDVLLLSSK